MLDEIRPTAGSASILGMDSREPSLPIRNSIGCLPGERTTNPTLTGRSTLTYHEDGV
jgi:ABC-2 type transport system ATP-binding protein